MASPALAAPMGGTAAMVTTASAVRRVIPGLVVPMVSMAWTVVTAHQAGAAPMAETGAMP